MDGQYEGINLNIKQIYIVLEDGDILYSCPPVLDPNVSISPKQKLINMAKKSK